MKSMTGYGKGEAQNDSKKVAIELKSVNNRYLEINSRLSKYFSFADEIVKKCVQEKIKRGTVEVLFSYEVMSGSGKVIAVDKGLAAEYIKAAKILSETTGIDSDFGINQLMKMPDVLSVTAPPENREELEELFKLATEKAIVNLENMREVEGESIKIDLKKLAGNIVSSLSEVKFRVPSIVIEYKEKLKKRIKELCEDVSVDETRFASEVAFFADRSDINEEISRLTSHVEQFFSALEDNESVGRRLDFISQEMNREINTMGSKANDLSLTKYVIEMKNELEKIKEQIRNVE